MLLFASSFSVAFWPFNCDCFSCRACSSKGKTELEALFASSFSVAFWPFNCDCFSCRARSSK
eukprot:Pgem_evm2s10162